MEKIDTYRGYTEVRMKNISLFLLFTGFITAISPLSGQVNPERQWSSYRGYMSTGVLDNSNLPESFDFAKMINVKWKVRVPGLGNSSPVIWDNRLFITTATSVSDNHGFKPGYYGDGTSVGDSSVHEWKIFCYDKNSGKTLWEQTAYKGVPAIKRHPKSTHANPTVATDGKYVVAFFGSEGLYCYDMDGKLQWKKNFGVLKAVAFNLPSAEWEFASSPLIFNGVIIIQCDVLENSFIAAFEAKTGKELWKTSRDDYPAWSTPNIYRNGENYYVVVNGYNHMGGYDFKTGKEIWRLSGGGDVPIPTPLVVKDIIYLNSAHGKNSPIFAIMANASGNITLQDKETSNQFIKWSIPRGGSYIQSLLVYRDRLYNLSWNGLLVCYDPLTGKETFRGKLGNSKSFMASPVASDGRIFAVDEEGLVYILKDGDELKILAEIPLNDICMTTPAITDGFIFFRTQNYLIAVAKN